jgi:hypothetical protein
MQTPSSLKDRIAHTLFNKEDPVWRRPGFPIGALVVVYLVIGMLLVTHYGESVDEPPRMSYAQRSLEAYSVDKGSLADEKGPFFGMLALVGSKILAFLVPGWKQIDGWHYMSFAAFVMGVYFFYRLCRRLVDPAPALAATLLFSTQPVLWGHGFINPKDNPFMAFFLASVCLGLEMVDHVQAQAAASGEKPSLRSLLAAQYRILAAEWGSASGGMRRLVKTLGLLLAALVVSYPLLRLLVAKVVGLAYDAPPASGLGRLFKRFAEHAAKVSLQQYIDRGYTLYWWAALIVGIGLAGFLIWAGLRVFPSVMGWSIQRRVLLAGCFLGFCSDIRTLGPASGLLVAVYFLYKAGRKAIPYLLEYLGTGALVTYIFWPYLWSNPVGHYLASLSEAADFPFIGNIIFAGKIYAQRQLPAYFLPAVFTLQFTETALILILAGAGLAVFYLVAKPRLRMDMLLAGAWCVAPVAAAILLNSVIYNNFRQFLFVTPPLFLFAALALQAIWKRLQGRLLLFVPLAGLILLPGLYGDWQLHPYEYVYYNSLVGGIAGASVNYEGDYWVVTYKEAVQYVNQVAPENAVVFFWVSDVTALPYARPDLKLTSDENLARSLHLQSFYAVIPTRFVGSQYFFPKSKEIYQIRRGGAVLAVVKLVNVSDYP